MLISYGSKKLEKHLTQPSLTLKTYGKDRARRISQRLAELEAAPTLSDISKLPPARCHALTGDRKGQFSVDISDNYRLLFEPDHDPLPLLPDKGLDLQQITAIRILDIADTH